MRKGSLATDAEDSPRFDAVVEAADRLTPDEQQTLIEVLGRRLAERGRAKIVSDVNEAQREFESGALHSVSPHEIMKDVLS
ncbi:MAG TPA: hypothetical protein VG860_22430 [Terriglobia bacterium]|jgi:hypothetical protein|nr:hypothetical protein [Terriglobia bacterium]